MVVGQYLSWQERQGSVWFWREHRGFGRALLLVSPNQRGYWMKLVVKIHSRLILTTSSIKYPRWLELTNNKARPKPRCSRQNHTDP